MSKQHVNEVDLSPTDTRFEGIEKDLLFLAEGNRLLRESMNHLVEENSKLRLSLMPPAPEPTIQKPPRTLS